MATFGVIDADTHVDENEATWQSLEEKGSKYVPVSISPDAQVKAAVADRPEAAGVRVAGALGNRWWLVENRLQPRFVRDEIHHPLREHRELDDAAGVAGRLKDMDKMGVDAQIIFPTFFIRYGAQDPDAEADLTGAYNRWLADRCAMSNGRLRWAAVLPLLDPDKAVAELRWAKENGASAIFKRGFDLDKPVNDKHFFPVYEEADSLNMPLCIHTGHPLPGREWDRGFPVMAAFLAVVSGRLPSKFPNLRFGFIEAGAAWIPYALSNLGMVQRSLALHDRSATFEPAEGPLPHRPLIRDDGPDGPDRAPAGPWHRGQSHHRHRLLPLRPVGEPRGAGRGQAVGERGPHQRHGSAEDTRNEREGVLQPVGRGAHGGMLNPSLSAQALTRTAPDPADSPPSYPSPIEGEGIE